MRAVILILSLISTVSVSACANDPSGRARVAMEESKTAYTDCVSRNQETPANCESLKAAMDENIRDYMRTTNPNTLP